MQHMNKIASRYHTAVITAEGKVAYWKKEPILVDAINSNGDNIVNYSTSCDFHEDSNNIVSIKLGERHSVALTADGCVICAGDNLLGQCNVPPNLKNVVQIDCSNCFSAALTA